MPKKRGRSSVPVRAEESVERLFVEPDRLDGLLLKILTCNDDSGRHGVLIPKEAYGFFPDISGFKPSAAANYTEPITTIWPQESGNRKRSSWKHYHRYPERRVTALRCARLDRHPPNSVIVFAHRADEPRAYEVVVLHPGEAGYDLLLHRFGLDPSEANPGVFGIDLRRGAMLAAPRSSAALDDLLGEFDRVMNIGWIPSLRRGPTGVGYTFESLLGIKENNDGTPDFHGIEIKTTRSSDKEPGGQSKRNLFLQEPTWTDGLTTAARIREYGYVDKDGRQALYSAVTVRTNSHRLALRVATDSGTILLTKHGEPVAFWRRDAIERRLREKLHETAYIVASARREKEGESFQFHSLVHCSGPSTDQFIGLLLKGDVLVEIRMHLNPKGVTRNHGTAFRVKASALRSLFALVRQLRSASDRPTGRVSRKDSGGPAR